MIVLYAVLIGLVAATAMVALRKSDPPVPSWQGAMSSCRAKPMEHVHDPKRLEQRSRCATFHGRVKSVKFVPAFDDLKISITPDGGMRKYLPAANGGVLIADVIATDQLLVEPPPVGSEITAWGAWVMDKATKSMMLLPTYRVVIERAAGNNSVITGHSVEKRGPPVARTLALTVTATRRVVVGGRIDVLIHAWWQMHGGDVPASQVRLFLEMVAANGVAVRWKAAMTDSRGIVSLHMVAIQVPTACTLTVYATPSHQDVSVQAPIRIAKA